MGVKPSISTRALVWILIASTVLGAFIVLTIQRDATQMEHISSLQRETNSLSTLILGLRKRLDDLEESVRASAARASLTAAALPAAPVQPAAPSPAAEPAS